MAYQVILAEDEPITRMDISEILTNSGYNVIGKASNGLEVIELSRIYKPDLVLMDIKMPKLDGIQAAQMILKESLTDSIVMITAYVGKEFVERVKGIGALGYLVKPIDERTLIPQLEIAISKGKEIKKMKNKMARTEKKIEETKAIHQAKEIMMEKYLIKENEAYDRIRKLSMDRRCSILETSLNLLKLYGKAD